MLFVMILALLNIKINLYYVYLIEISDKITYDIIIK